MLQILMTGTERRIYELQQLSWLNPQRADINYSEEDQHLRPRFPSISETLQITEPRFTQVTYSLNQPDFKFS